MRTAPALAVRRSLSGRTLFISLLLGLRSVVQPVGASPDQIAPDLERDGSITHAFLLPIDAYRIVERAALGTSPFPESLRQLVLFSAPITTGVLERLYDVAPDVDVLCVYGMTELVPAAMIDGRDKLDRMAGSDGDVQYVVMDLVAGTPLDKVLRYAEPLLAERVTENVRRFARGEDLVGLVDVDAGY